MEVKKKQGKTKIDKDINEYLRKKNINSKKFSFSHELLITTKSAINATK